MRTAEKKQCSEVFYPQDTIQRFNFPETSVPDESGRPKRKHFNHATDTATIAVSASDNSIGCWLTDHGHPVIVNGIRQSPLFVICVGPNYGPDHVGFWRYGGGVGMPYAIGRNGIQVPDLNNPKQTTLLTFEQLHELVELQKRMQTTPQD